MLRAPGPDTPSAMQRTRGRTAHQTHAPRSLGGRCDKLHIVSSTIGGVLWFGSQPHVRHPTLVTRCHTNQRGRHTERQTDKQNDRHTVASCSRIPWLGRQSNAETGWVYPSVPSATRPSAPAAAGQTTPPARRQRLCHGEGLGQCTTTRRRGAWASTTCEARCQPGWTKDNAVTQTRTERRWSADVDAQNSRKALPCFVHSCTNLSTAAWCCGSSALGAVASRGAGAAMAIGWRVLAPICKGLRSVAKSTTRHNSCKRRVPARSVSMAEEAKQGAAPQPGECCCCGHGTMWWWCCVRLFVAVCRRAAGGGDRG